MDAFTEKPSFYGSAIAPAMREPQIDPSYIDRSLMRSVQSLIYLIATLSVISGCATIPNDDIAFLDKRIPVGIGAAQAEEIVTRRGFTRIQTFARPQSRFDQVSQSFKRLPLSDIEIAQQNIGFVSLEGAPNGQLRCFARAYTRIIASGHRVICWTIGEDNKITWRQAGWRGAML